MPEGIKVLHRGDLNTAGHWQPTLDDENKPTALVSCPGCGKIQVLDMHRIDRSGHVAPSVACCWNCGFHEFVVLKGWTECQNV